MFEKSTSILLTSCFIYFSFFLKVGTINPNPARIELAATPKIANSCPVPVWGNSSTFLVGTEACCSFPSFEGVTSFVFVSSFLGSSGFGSGVCSGCGLNSSLGSGL